MVAVVYYTDLFRVLIEDTRVNRLFLNLGLAAGGGLACVVLYIAIWVPYSECGSACCCCCWWCVVSECVRMFVCLCVCLSVYVSIYVYVCV